LKSWQICLEEGLDMKSLYKILSWLVAIILPIVIVLSVVSSIINPWYLQFEYHMPGFPDDPYGFTPRSFPCQVCLDYLLNSADISYLGDLRLPVGQQVPEPSCQYMADCTHYNDRELEHTLDVKNVVNSAMLVLGVGLVLLFVLVIWAWMGKWMDDYLLGLQDRGILVLYCWD
jgi:hypothetical protein